jgi:hypothetical protein
MSRHQGKEEAPEDGGHRGFLVPWGNNDGEGKSHQVYHLIIADRLINAGQVSRVVGSVSGNVGFGSIADLSSAHPTVCFVPRAEVRVRSSTITQ